MCVTSSRAPLAVAATAGTGTAVAAVINFPHGSNDLAACVTETQRAVEVGCSELDIVLPQGLIADSDWAAITHWCRTVVRASDGHSCKAIIETAAWDRERIAAAGHSALDAGFSWLKTSTGYHPNGGADEQAVKLLARIAGQRAAVKASGGIRTLADVRAMLDAGAERIGTSNAAAILAEHAAGR